MSQAEIKILLKKNYQVIHGSLGDQFNPCVGVLRGASLQIIGNSYIVPE